MNHLCDRCQKRPAEYPLDDHPIAVCERCVQGGDEIKMKIGDNDAVASVECEGAESL
jgi:hypothetical protein